MHNESEALPVSIDRLMKLRDIPDNSSVKAELIMIDDGSTEGSNGVTANFKDLMIVRHRRRRGYGASLRTGFRTCKGDFIGSIERDNTYDPMYFAKLLDILIRSCKDMVFAHRM